MLRSGLSGAFGFLNSPLSPAAGDSWSLKWEFTLTLMRYSASTIVQRCITLGKTLVYSTGWQNFGLLYWSKFLMESHQDLMIGWWNLIFPIPNPDQQSLTFFWHIIFSRPKTAYFHNWSRKDHLWLICVHHPYGTERGDLAENQNIRSSRGAASYILTFEMVLPGGRVQFCFSNSPAGRPCPFDKPALVDRSGDRTRPPQATRPSRQDHFKSQIVLGRPAGGPYILIFGHVPLPQFHIA